MKDVPTKSGPARRRVTSRKRGPLAHADDAQRCAAIEAWFARHARDLPWRHYPRGHAGADGYAALVAELMLQQTQVDRVAPKYVAFMDRFPTAEALAAADEADVLSAWSGLGYYRRARALHAAAREIVRRGAMPGDVDGLRALPGLGRYSAGSIASITFGVRAAIVDGNVARVVQRWGARHGTAAEHADWSWRRAESLVRAASDPGAFNEGLMELGAVVCTPRNPDCTTCPVREWCAARRRGAHVPPRIPAPRVRPDRTVVHHHAVVICRAADVLLERRDGPGLWAGLWQAPTIEADGALDAAEVARRLPFRVSRCEPRGAFEFLTSHRAVQFHMFRASTRIRRGHWQGVARLDDVPMAAAQRRALREGLGES